MQKDRECPLFDISGIINYHLLKIHENKMATLSFDTHKAIERLIEKGFKKQHAEEVVNLVQESRNFNLNNIATKTDIAELKTNIAELKSELLKWFITTTFVIIGIMISGFAMIIQLLK